MTAKQISIHSQFNTLQSLVVNNHASRIYSRNIRAVLCFIASLRERGKTIITITHDIDFCAENFQRVVALSQGRVLLDGTANAVLGMQDILAQTYVDPPQLTRLGLRLGLPETVCNQEEFLNACKKYTA